MTRQGQMMRNLSITLQLIFASHIFFPSPNCHPHRHIPTTLCVHCSSQATCPPIPLSANSHHFPVHTAHNCMYRLPLQISSAHTENHLQKSNFLLQTHQSTPSVPIAQPLFSLFQLQFHPLCLKLPAR